MNTGRTMFDKMIKLFTDYIWRAGDCAVRVIVLLKERMSGFFSSTVQTRVFFHFPVLQAYIYFISCFCLDLQHNQNCRDASKYCGFSVHATMYHKGPGQPSLFSLCHFFFILHYDSSFFKSSFSSFN